MADLVFTAPAMLTVAWPDDTSITQVFPPGMHVEAAWAMVAEIAAVMDHRRHHGATWSVTPAPAHAH